MVRYAVLNEEISQAGHYVVAPQATGNDDRQTFPAIFIDNRQHPERLAVVRAILDEVIAPNMVLPGWPKPDTRSVIQPKPSPLRLPARHLQPLTSPNALHTTKAHSPALQAKQTPDPTIAVATIHPGQCDDGLREICVIVTPTLLVSLGRAVLTDDTTSTTL